MKLTWADDMYDRAVDSPREHHLVRGPLVEAAYAVDRLPDSEDRKRITITRQWGELPPVGLP